MPIGFWKSTKSCLEQHIYHLVPAAILGVKVWTNGLSAYCGLTLNCRFDLEKLVTRTLPAEEK